MNLVKWFRKNNRKIMAVVVAIMLIAFIGGTAFERIIGGFGGGRNRTIATFGQNRKIKYSDLNEAAEDLQILQMIGVQDVLKSMSMRTPNILPILLSQLLFSKQETAAEDAEYVIQMCRRQGYYVGEQQIYDIYRRSLSSEAYWLLLRNEAHQAGIRATNEQAYNILTDLYKGPAYTEIIGRIVTPPPGSQSMGVPEKRIFRAFADLISVLQYAQIVCSGEDLTENQIKHDISLERETMDAEYVRFDSETFAKSAPEPNAAVVLQHFEKFKNFFPGEVGEDNPYGFGYKLYDSVQMQYIAVKIDDVKKIAPKPTQEEVEDYYRKNQQAFTVTVPKDPNDSNSQMVEKIRSYPEVAEYIRLGLTNEKINSLTNDILLQAKSLTDADIESLSNDKKITQEEFEKISGNYKKIADQLSSQHKIRIYSGQTGLLSAADIQKDPNIGGLVLESTSTRTPAFMGLGLYKLAFAVEDINTVTLSPFENLKPKMYVNIGPLRDLSGRMKAIVRITKAVKAGPPESIDMMFSKDTFKLEPNDLSSNVVYVKASAASDLKKLAVMEETKNKAAEFAKIADQNEWDSAVKKFNELYGKKDKKPADPNTFQITKLSGTQRINKYFLQTFEKQFSGDPALQPVQFTLVKELLLQDQLYSLLPADSNNLGNVPYIMEFKPHLSYYCIKKLSVKRINQVEYAYLKAGRAYQQENANLQAMAPVFLNPDNITKRANFKLLPQERRQAPPDSASQ